MKIKVLHIVGGSTNNGAYKGAYILHKSLLKSGVDSIILNDTSPSNIKKVEISNFYKVNFLNKSFSKKILNFLFLFIEKILKSMFLHSNRSTFTLALLGFDITTLKEYKDADIIHIHWLNQGFINFRSISKINKPVVWTMRDMWAFTGGAHYTMDFEKYEKGSISKKIKKLKKNSFKKNIHFIAISDWLKNEAEKSYVLQDQKINTFYNNINLDDFKIIPQNEAKSFLDINTKKKIILYGANNPQNKRKGWDIFKETLKKLDKSKYFLIIFGNFWSESILKGIGIEYKNFGFVDDVKKLNAIYGCADLFVAPSIQEAFGKTWAESLASETPIVCFSNTSISEIINHKVNGFVINTFEPNALKIGIEWVSENLCKEKFKKGDLRKTVEKFDAEKISEKYIQLYKKILR